MIATATENQKQENEDYMDLMIKDSASTKVIIRMKKAEKKPFYSPASTTIQGILKDMYDTFAADLEKSNTDESALQKAFEDHIASEGLAWVFYRCGRRPYTGIP